MIPWPRWRSDQTGQRRMQHLQASPIPADVNCQVKEKMSEDSSSQQVCVLLSFFFLFFLSFFFSFCVLCYPAGSSSSIEGPCISSVTLSWFNLPVPIMFLEVVEKCPDIFRLKGVISLSTTKYEMLIVKFRFSVLESVSFCHTEARGGDSTFLQSPKHSKFPSMCECRCFWVSSSLRNVEMFLRWILLLFLQHTILELVPLTYRVLTVCARTISHMSETVVRVVPELLVRQKLNATESENRPQDLNVNRIVFRPVWPIYRSNHNTHLLS